jgi:hypothetical protein
MDTETEQVQRCRLYVAWTSNVTFFFWLVRLYSVAKFDRLSIWFFHADKILYFLSFSLYCNVFTNLLKWLQGSMPAPAKGVTAME